MKTSWKFLVSLVLAFGPAGSSLAETAMADSHGSSGHNSVHRSNVNPMHSDHRSTPHKSRGGAASAGAAAGGKGGSAAAAALPHSTANGGAA